MSGKKSVSLSFFGGSQFYPFNKISMDNIGIKNLGALKKEVQPIVENYRTSGADIPSDTSRKYWRIQSMCIGYRVQKLFAEMGSLKNTRISEITVKDVLMFLYASAKLFVFLMIGIMVGRQSIKPTMLPTDPKVGLMKKMYDV
mmetsp:Transcript_21390/g.33243  ORF Transcript_21390/g.33243 Transcript_21390/m.33243 type:complete len:143 (-) Transcript_21390:29-457(-)